MVLSGFKAWPLVQPRLKNALEAMPKRGELAIELLVCRDKRADI